MDTPEILEATCGFLRQIPDLDDRDPIKVPPALLQELENAATEAKKELDCKCTVLSSEPLMLTQNVSP